MNVTTLALQNVSSRYHFLYNCYAFETDSAHSNKVHLFQNVSLSLRNNSFSLIAGAIFASF